MYFNKQVRVPHSFAIMAIILMSLLSGCSSTGSNGKNFLQKVSPWQKQHLSEKAMSWEVDATEAGLERHIFFAKEASSGGDQATGGGCGCN